MTRERRPLPRIVAVVIVLGATAIAVPIIKKWLRRSPINTISVIGAVMRKDTDPKKQPPIADTKIYATGSLFPGNTTSDSSCHFSLTLRPGVPPDRPITLRFEHPEYKPLEISEVLGDQLYIVRMEPVNGEPPTKVKHTETPVKAVQIKDIRVRYLVKDQTTINVGSLARQFEVVNTGNVPCRGGRPCSPDGKWKAAHGSLSLDAQEGNEFRNVRISCIAGPCPFTKIEPNDLSHPSRTINVSVLNWSDTAGFLVEAELTRTVVSDMVRHSYPFVIGQTMSFALPAAAEGPSVEATLNGEEIVFPLGPNLILSWATCSVETGAGNIKIYRCEIRPGYQFSG